MHSDGESILKRLRAGLPALKREFPLRRLALFGSVVRGDATANSDIDILADVKPAQVIPLLNALQGSFYVDEHAVREAIDRQQSFNAIHFDSVFKVDIFIPKSDDFSRKQIERRELRKLAPDGEQMIYVATAEDTLLAKLRWYDSGGRVSNNQWTDVVGIIGASATSLDLDYLREWAETLGLIHLLDKAFLEGQDVDRGN